MVRLVVPDSMSLVAKVDIKGPEYKSRPPSERRERSYGRECSINTSTEVYKADLKIDNLQLHNFFRKIIYELTLFRLRLMVVDWMSCLIILLPN